MENLLSSPKLFRLVFERDIAAHSTVRSVSSGFPKCLAARGKKNVRLEWNYFVVELCQKGAVVALTWIDKSPVQMITTVHYVEQGYSVELLSQRPKL